MSLMLALLGCAWIGSGEIDARFDQDGDGHEDPQWEGDDCDDADPAVHPGASDAWYDGVDSNCALDNDFDADADGVLAPEGGGTDCDDTDPAVYPGAVEVPNGKDDDCDSRTDEAPSAEDADGDGLSEVEGDCDDTDSDIFPGATEVFYDGVDQDCDPTNEFDRDGDGFDAEAYGGSDCDDSDPAISPDAREEALDGIDNDCDGVTL